MRKITNYKGCLVITFLCVVLLYSCSRQEATRQKPSIMQSGRSLLIGENPEASYGMYTYILFSHPPNDNTRARYSAIIGEYLNYNPIEEFEPYYSPDSLNIVYLPVTERPADASHPDSLLEVYNYSRAQVIINTLPEEYRHRSGVYLVSSLKPLTGADRLEQPYIIQELSTIPPHIIDLWMEEFLKEALSPRSWGEKAMHKMVLTLRTNIARAAEGWATAETAVTQFLTFRSSLGN